VFGITEAIGKDGGFFGEKRLIPIRYQKMRFDFDIYRYKTRKKPTSESE